MCPPSQLPSAAMPLLHGIHRPFRPAENGLEHQEQHDSQQQRSADRMQHQRIQPLQQAQPGRYPVADVIENPPHFGLGGLDFRGAAAAELDPARPPAAGCGVRSSNATSSRSPPGRMATVSTTGRPMARASAALSSRKPRARARSDMFSATTMGRPRRFSSSTRRRFRRRLVASTTHTIRSGGCSEAWRPRTISRVMASSRVVGCRL